MSEAKDSGKSTENTERLESLHREWVAAKKDINQAIYEAEKAADRQKSK